MAPSDILLGAGGSAVSLSLGYGALSYTRRVMENWGVGTTGSQSYFHLYDVIGTVSSGLLRGILKTVAIFYIVVLIPIVEEWFFRGVMYSWQEATAPAENKMSARIFRVLSNGLVFGAFHFNLLLGWTSIPIVVVSTIAGIVFSSLRELSGDFWASTVAHSLNNSAVLFVNILRI